MKRKEEEQELVMGQRFEDYNKFKNQVLMLQLLNLKKKDLHLKAKWKGLTKSLLEVNEAN